MEKIILIVLDVPPSCNQQRKKKKEKNFLTYKNQRNYTSCNYIFIKFKTPKLQFHTILANDEMI